MANFTKINPKLIQAELSGEEVFARKGSMLAYQGQVSFSRSFLGSGGMQELAARAVTGEGLPLIRCRGQGKVCFGMHGLDVTLVELEGETFFTESSCLLAFDAKLRSGVVFQGNQGVSGLVRGAATGQGLFTSTLEGHGFVAIITQGDAEGLEVSPDRPVFVDPNAYVGHRGNLTSSFKTDINWKTLIGQTSGESYQLGFTGTGTVYIQCDER